MFFHEYIGNIHIHTIHSDGGEDYGEIARKALDAGLDFACINDHEHMTQSLNLEKEGYYGKLLLLIGIEIGRRYHHYLAYDIKGLVESRDRGPQAVIDEVNSQKGFGFLAHPFEKGMPFYEKSVAYTWNDLSVSGFTGVCIWNFSSRWKERVRTIFHGIFFMAFKSLTLKGPSRETLSFWDELCRKGRVAAVGGSDAHGGVFKLGPFRFIPLKYDFLLRTINIHVFLKERLSRDFKAAKKEIYEAMREGRLFIANDSLYPARGFRFYFLSDDGSDVVMGEEDRFTTGNLIVELPAEGEMRLIKNGIPVDRRQGTEAVFPVTEKGVFRIEVYRRKLLFGMRPWIFSNPIYLR